MKKTALCGRGKACHNLVIVSQTAESKWQFALTLFLLSMIPHSSLTSSGLYSPASSLSQVSQVHLSLDSTHQCSGFFWWHTTESQTTWGWTATSGGHLVQPSCSSRAASCPGSCPDAFSLTDRDCTISVDNLCQGLVTITTKKHFLKCLPLILGLAHWQFHTNRISGRRAEREEGPPSFSSSELLKGLIPPLKIKPGNVSDEKGKYHT